MEKNLWKIINNYEKKWGITMCAGAIDGTHIPILAPEESHLVYVNTDTSALSCKQCWILIIYSKILS